MQVGVAQLEQVCDPHGMWPTIILRAVAQRVSLLRRPAGIQTDVGEVGWALGVRRTAQWPLGCSDGPMPIRVFSRSDHAAGLAILRQTFVRRRYRWQFGGKAGPGGASIFQSRRDCPGAAARANPRMSVSAVMIAASLGWAAMAIAAALLAEKETAPHNGSRVVRAQGLARP